LSVARRNAAAHGVGRRVFFLEGDLMSRFSPGLHLDAVVANLPYVDEKDMESLDPEVRREPALALDGGRGGLDVIRRLIVQAWEKLLPDGQVFLEIGHDQAAAVSDLFRGMGYRKIEVGRDFAGVERFVAGTK
jgi:release factor glutamine methyltransferase